MKKLYTLAFLCLSASIVCAGHKKSKKLDRQKTAKTSKENATLEEMFLERVDRFEGTKRKLIPEPFDPNARNCTVIMKEEDKQAITNFFESTIAQQEEGLIARLASAILNKELLTVTDQEYETIEGFPEPVEFIAHPFYDKKRKSCCTIQ